jgi:hypothetical protein
LILNPAKANAVTAHLVLIDSITELSELHLGAVVFTGSHGGVSAAHYALLINTTLVVFNDAGVGKDNAGIAALAILQAQNRAAATVAHHSACIGNAQDTLAHGMISHVNEHAAGLGLMVGQRCSEWLLSFNTKKRTKI